MIKKLKVYQIKFLKIIFKHWIPEEQSKVEVAQGLYSWIIKNRPAHFEFHCPVCGQLLAVKNIEEKHFMKDCVVLIYKCNKKCQFNVQRRFTHGMIEIKNM